MKYLLNSLTIFLFFTGCASINGVKRADNATSTDLQVWSDVLKTDTAKITLRIDIQVKDNTFSGLCILKRINNELKGTVINDFGAKAFDFIVNEENCRLLGVNQMLDKKYIRKTIEKDLHFLFEADNNATAFYREEERFEQNDTLIINYKKKQIKKEASGTITLSNLKYGIRYKFRNMIEIDRNKTIL
ncbi:MAG: hypothetical protein LBN11_04060 [Tannerella sp.]|jgi:hypothetical protein|nr:hypothetical protein [Tannerella sp.]